MKTLMTAALTAVLALTGFATASERVEAPSKQQYGGVQNVQKLSLDDIRNMLVNLGYTNPDPMKNDNGYVVGYRVILQHSTTRVPCRITLSQYGDWINFYVQAPHTIGANTSKDALLGLISANFDIRPASISYVPQHGKIEVLLSIPNVNVTADAMRSALNQFAKSGHQVMELCDKLLGQPGGQMPNQPSNPLPPTTPSIPSFPTTPSLPTNPTFPANPSFPTTPSFPTPIQPQPFPFPPK